MASLWRVIRKIETTFLCFESSVILCTNHSRTKNKDNSNSDLQCTTSLHLSSIALSGMNGFSERHVKYFPSSSTTGMNVRTLNDWLPVSENCGNGWKMVRKLARDIRIFSRHQIVSSLCTVKLSCYQWKFMKHSNQGRERRILQLRFQMNRRKLNSYHASLSAWKYENLLAAETIIVCWLINSGIIK